MSLRDNATAPETPHRAAATPAGPRFDLRCEGINDDAGSQRLPATMRVV